MSKELLIHSFTDASLSDSEPIDLAMEPNTSALSARSHVSIAR